MKEKYSTDVQLIPSEGGVFEVVVDGRLIYSKKNLNRFPEEGEVEGLIG
ncbi:hypothetical protein LA52FAK_23820 [Desulforhopalus sp. 52FAK]